MWRCQFSHGSSIARWKMCDVMLFEIIIIMSRIEWGQDVTRFSRNLNVSRWMTDNVQGERCCVGPLLMDGSLWLARVSQPLLFTIHYLQMDGFKRETLFLKLHFLFTSFLLDGMPSSLFVYFSSSFFSLSSLFFFFFLNFSLSNLWKTNSTS